MLYSPRRAAAAALISSLMGSIALTGCSTGSNATVTHNPPLSTFGGKSTARSSVQTAILVANTSNGLAFPGGPTPAAIGRRVLDVMAAHGRRISAATGACTNSSKTSQVNNADGTATVTTDLYYDPLCATLEEEQVLIVAKPGDPETSAAGTMTTYDRAGAVTSYHILTITASAVAATSTTPASQSVVYNDAASATVKGTVIAAVGASCTGAPNSPTMNCSIAMYGTAAPATFGQTVATAATAGTGGANTGETVSVNFFGSGITGVALSGTAWTVTGPSAFNVGTGTYSYASTGTTGNGTFSLTDTLYTYTVTAKLTATGLAVTIVRNTDPIATAAVDAAGNGLITYADGSTDTIAGGVIDV